MDGHDQSHLFFAIAAFIFHRV